MSSWRARVPLTRDDLLTAATEVLATRGPLGEAELLAALLLAGHDLGAHPLDTLAELLDDDVATVAELPDGRLVALPALLEGRIVTHRLTALEVAHGVLAIEADLLAVAPRLEADERWDDGLPVRSLLLGDDDAELADRGVPEDAPVELLLLPAGALDGASAGDVVGVRPGPDGWSVVPPGTLGTAPSDLPERVTAALDGAPRLLESVVWTLCVDDSDLLRTPLPPLSELLVTAGFVLDEEWLAPAGTDVAAWHHDQLVARLGADHGLAPDAAAAVLVLLELHDEVAAGLVRAAGTGGEDGARRAALAGALAFLADPAVADAVLAEVVGPGWSGDAQEEADLEALAAIARSAEQVAPRTARAGLRWLLATALELIGETAEAEAAFESVLAEDPGWVPALLDLARYASDRGDVERALSLLRRAEVHADDELVTLLEQFRVRPRADLGRNDRCWCGSGRKYKQCHLGKEELPLAERAGWLHAKALQFLDAGCWALEIRVLDEVHACALEDAGLPWDEAGDGFVPDVALAEGGGLAAFLAARGELLPADERAAAAEWLGVRRSVHEVAALSGDGVTLRDLRTGAEVALGGARRTGIRVGDTVTARVLPVAGELRAPGGVDLVRPGWRGELLSALDAEPTATAVVRALTLATRTDRPG